METPVRIFFVGNSPSGGKLRARFVGSDLPTSIQVKGTNDVQPVKLRRNNKGQIIGRWLSKNKYTSRTQTLQLIQCGHVVQECKYDSCGDQVIENPKVTLNPTSSITTANGAVNYVWTSVLEESLDQYASEKKIGTAAWEAFDADEPDGAGSTYSSTDYPSASATIDYRLRAIFMDGTEKVLLSQTLSVVVPPTSDAVVPTFAAQYNTDTGNIDLNWKSSSEINVVSYTILLKGSQNPDYVEALTVDALGANIPYAFGVFADGGEYSVRLRANFNNATSKVVSEVPVSVPVA
jgi:hypothetical protein